mmetsp:Transcript_12376/g.28597  ORF Transcript_12376/g.28597 Transcript_12376/m.28597 type:complete len:294 (+) Transcript_12376:268-1149(+)
MNKQRKTSKRSAKPMLLCRTTKKRQIYDTYGKEAADQSENAPPGHGGFGGMPHGFGGFGGGGHGMRPDEAEFLFSQFFGGSDPFGGIGGGRRGSGFQMHMGGQPFGQPGRGGGFGGGMPRRQQRRPTEKRYDAIPTGTTVSLKGLVSKPEKNGDRGEVTGYDPSTGRYVVQFEDTEDTLKVKPSNLLQHVHGKVFGLEGKVELNNEKVTIIAWDETQERYNVYVMKLRKCYSVRPSNIVLDSGSVGRITGLQSKPELNGKYGTINSFDNNTGRYDVQVSKDKILRLKLDNIRL